MNAFASVSLLKASSLIVVTFFVALFSRFTEAESTPHQPSAVMVIDLGFNYERLLQRNPELAKRFDLDLLERNQVPGGSSVDQSKESLLESNVAAEIQFNRSPKDHLNHLELVASIAGAADVSLENGFANVRLIPVVEPIAQMLLRGKTKRYHLIEEMKAFVESYFEAINGIIKEEGIRLIIRSMGGSRTSLVKICSPFFSTDSERQKCASVLADHYAKLSAKLFAENPQAVFVVTAGNSSSEASVANRKDFDALKAPNVLVVSAVDLTGRALEYYSSWSKSLVRVAALGKSPPISDKPWETIDGVSFAAPRTAISLREILQSNVDLAGSEAIDRFLRVSTRREPLLYDKIREGRILNDKYYRSRGGCDLFLKRLTARAKNLVNYYGD